MSHALAQTIDHPLGEISDAELAQRAVEGDEGAFVAIMRRHNRLLFRTARAVLRNDADAEDALQQAYLRAWRAIGSFRAEARLSTWLVRIVANEALARARRPALKVIPLDTVMSSTETDPLNWLQDDADKQPDRITMRTELRRLMEARIDQLPDDFRWVFVLRGVQELSVEEVASALAIPEATVRSRFFRARDLLRKGLSQDFDMALGDAFAFDGERCARLVAAVIPRLTPRPGRAVA
ncbi:RNA polymerase sigma factor [Ottowia sp. GY511]|uniref:RNA polymerase sigma factor n=1 Tax=Ottowia flava TaxID=2675430 RepID=A0ABW4KS32_9BURK|nr:RNA polymerase sigma factor [Ottowia sp. GY511]TXK23592.1 RNA polymerase sigma factor [Ottowia sp. GY511]